MDNPSTHEEPLVEVDVTNTQAVGNDTPRAKYDFHTETLYKINNSDTRKLSKLQNINCFYKERTMTIYTRIASLTQTA